MFNPNLKIRLTAKQKVSQARNAWIGARASNVEPGSTKVEIPCLPVSVVAFDSTGRRKKAYVTFVVGLEDDVNQTHGVAVEIALSDVSAMCHEIFVPEPERKLGQVVAK